MDLGPLDQLLTEGLQAIAPLEELPLLIHNPERSNKSSQIVIRLTPEEKDALLERAQGKTLSAYIRATLFNSQSPQKVSQKNWEAALLLGQMSSTLNQLLQNVHDMAENPNSTPPSELKTIETELTDLKLLTKQAQKTVLQISNASEQTLLEGDTENLR